MEPCPSPIPRWSASARRRATWFGAAFAEPTPAQAGAWEAIAQGRHALVVAPTGSGKTLSAFLWAIDRLLTDAAAGRRARHPGPLRLPAQGARGRRRAQPAGAADRHPADRRAARRAAARGQRRHPVRRHPGRRAPHPGAHPARHPDHHARVAVPDADQPGPREPAPRRDRDRRRGPRRRRHQARRPSRAQPRAPRRPARPKPAQRIGLSATVRPLEEVARFLGGTRAGRDRRAAVGQAVGPQGRRPGRGHDRSPAPYDDSGEDDADGDGREATSIWPHVENHVADLIEQHRSTIVFANSRRLAERLTARLNEIAAERAGRRASTTDGPAARRRSWPSRARRTARRR